MDNSKVAISICISDSVGEDTGPKGFTPAVNTLHTSYTGDYLIRRGGVYGSTISMTDNGYMTI